MSRWSLIPFEDAVVDATGGNPKVLTSALSAKGQFPVLDQGQNSVSGYVDDEKLLCRRSKGAVILFGDHTKTIKYVDFDFVLGADGVKVLEAKPGFEPKFLFHYLSSIRLPDDLGYSRHFKYLKRATVPKPSSHEQCRIVAILDKAEAIRKKSCQSLKLADELLRSVFLDMFGDYVKNPDRWELSALGERIEFITSGSRGWAAHYAPKGGKFLRIQNVCKNRLLLDDIAFVEAPNTTEAKRTRVRPGDLLISITADLGRTAVIPPNFGEGYINQHLALLRLRDIEPIFVSAWLQSPHGQMQFKRLNRDGVKAGLNFDDLRSLQVALPPRSLQEKFVFLVNHIERIQELHKLAKRETDYLFSSIAQKAFSGQL